MISNSFDRHERHLDWATGIFMALMMGIVLCVLIALPFTIKHDQERADNCNKRGGTVITGHGTWACVRKDAVINL